MERDCLEDCLEDLEQAWRAAYLESRLGLEGRSEEQIKAAEAGRP